MTRGARIYKNLEALQKEATKFRANIKLDPDGRNLGNMGYQVPLGQYGKDSLGRLTARILATFTRNIEEIVREWVRFFEVDKFRAPGKCVEIIQTAAKESAQRETRRVMGEHDANRRTGAEWYEDSMTE